MHIRKHPARYVRAQAYQSGAITDAHRIYRDDVFLEFPTDTRMGLHLAYLRTFAVPRIAELLDRTGHTAAEPDRRAADTGLFMCEVINSGVESPRGRAVIRRLNELHRRWPIAIEDYRYILCTFIVVPTRFIDRYSWRPLTRAEREACTAFYFRLGELMGISNPPAHSYDEASQFLTDYEAAHVAPSSAGQHLLDKSRHIFTERLPRPIQPAGDRITAALIDNQRIVAALGLPKVSPPFERAVRAVFAGRAAITRRQEPITDSWFTPGQHKFEFYPGGYELSDLGPAR